MKKIAIVGVEGSGKTVMLACLGEFYTRPDENGYFLEPKNFQTAAYVMDKISRMRKGEWPMATSDDVMQGLNWTLRRRNPGGGSPEKVCEISFLDFGGEVYRAAFGMREGVDEALSNEIKQLKDYVSAADELIVLVNLRDVINKGVSDKRVYESIWITKSILDSAFNSSEGTPPRTSIAITQSDSYADTIRTCGGAKRVIEEYLPHIYNSYDWLDMYDVTAVDKTILNDDGNPVPDPGFKPDGLRVLMNWIINSREKDVSKNSKVGGFSETNRQGSNINSDKEKNTRLAIEAFEAERWKEAFRLSKNADRNDSTLQFYLGVLYSCGFVVMQDDSEAVKWYRKSAEQGVAVAQSNLGDMYLEGRGVTQDDSEAVKWYRKSAEQGNAVAQSNLGWMYREGRGVTQDDSEAVKWYRKSAEQGDAVAQRNLGWMYVKGRGVTQDDSEAVKWYRKSAVQGDANAQDWLGWMYQEGRGVTQDDYEAVEWYRKSAVQGYASAQRNLGVMYYNGRGVTKDDSEAAKWFRKSAEQGNADAQNWLDVIKKKRRDNVIGWIFMGVVIYLFVFEDLWGKIFELIW